MLRAALAGGLGLFLFFLAPCLVATEASAPAPVSVQEAASILEKMERAYEEEDLEAMEKLMAPEEPGFPLYRANIQRLFREFNYFEATFDDVELAESPDGSVAGRARQSLQFEEVGTRIVERRRHLVSLQFERSEEGAVRIVRLLGLPDPALPEQKPVRATHYDLDVEVLPDSHQLRVEGEISLKNTSLGDVQGFSFLLDGFYKDLSVQSLEGADLLQRVRRGGRIVGDLELPAPIPSGETTVLRFSYRIERPHPESDFRIQPHAVLLRRGVPWYPWFHDVAEVQEPAFRFDLRVRVPKGWAAITSGSLQDRSESDGVTRFAWYMPDLTGEIPLVAGPYERRSMESIAPDADAGPVAISVWVPRGQESNRFAAVMVERVASAYRWIASKLGPPPHLEAHVVFAPINGYYGGSYLWMIDDTTFQELPPWAPEQVRVFAHHAAHCWFVQGVEASGPGRAFLREALSEYVALRHLAATNGEPAFDRHMRFRLESFLQMLTSGVPMGLESRIALPFIEGARIRGVLVMRELSRFLGEDVLLEGLGRYVQQHARGSATIWDLQGAISAACLDRELDPDTLVVPFFADYIFGDKVPDPSIEKVDSIQEGDRWIHSVHLKNLRQGRIRVPVGIVNGKNVEIQEVLLETGGSAIATIETDFPMKYAVVDPQASMYQSVRGNDWFPHQPIRPDRGLGHQRVPTEKVQEALEEAKRRKARRR